MSSEVPDTLIDQQLEPSIEDPDQEPEGQELADQQQVDEETAVDDETLVDDEASAEEETFADEVQPAEEAGELDEADNITPNPQPIAELVDDVQLALTFEVGSASIKLGQLQSLLPGYTFELSTPLDSPVVIKAFGQVIGRGQLVKIGDRLGVCLAEITCHGS